MSRGLAADSPHRGPQAINRSTFTLQVDRGDVAWIADVDERSDVVTVAFQNLRLVGHASHLESLVTGLVELLTDLRECPELAELLLPVMKRRDPSARRTESHPLTWTVD